MNQDNQESQFDSEAQSSEENSQVSEQQNQNQLSKKSQELQNDQVNTQQQERIDNLNHIQIETQFDQPAKQKIQSIDQIKNTRKPISSQQRAIFRGYDGQKIPPDFDKAAEHRLANQVGPEKDINQIQEDETIEYCECCARQIQRHQLKLRCNIYELSFLGSGYPLYFFFIKQCIVMLSLVLFICGVFNVITNIIGSGKCQSASSESDQQNSTNQDQVVCKQGNVFSLFYLGRKSDQETFMEIQGYLNLSSMIAMIILLQWFRKLQRQLDAKCDDEDISANDYTIMIKNVPKDFEAINDDYDDDIKEFFRVNSLEGKEVEVESVTLCYDLSEITKLELEKQQLIQKKKKYIFKINNLKKKIDEIFHINSCTHSIQNDLENNQQGIKIIGDSQQPIQATEGDTKFELNILQPNNTVCNIFNKEISSKEENRKSITINNEQIQDKLQSKENDQNLNKSETKYPNKESINQLNLKNQQVGRQITIFRQNQKDQNVLDKLNFQLTEESVNLAKIQLNIQKVDKQLKTLNEKLMDGKGREFMKNYFTGNAFVCVKYEQDKEDIIERYRPIGISDKILSKEKNLVQHQMIYKDNKLSVIQAPDPTDINWNNLHYSQNEKIKRRLIGFISTVASLLVCALGIYGFHLFQQYEINKQNASSLKLQIISSSLAILITIFNFILLFILQIISKYCKYSTRTKDNIFIAKGLSVARFVNSALISFIIQIYVQSNKDKQTVLFGQGGLSDNANYFMISNCFVPFLSELINPEYYLLILLRKIEAKKGVESIKTQSELNQLYENPEFQIQERYAQILMTMFTTAFYSPIVPMTIFWSLIGLILQYWVDKYNLIHRSCVKNNMSAELSIEMTEHLEYFLPIQSISTLIFYQYANGGDWGLSSIIGTAIGLLHAFLPMQLINERFFEINKASANTIDYEEAQKYFITDYSRENPIYKQQARQTHVKKMTIRISNQKDFLRRNGLRFTGNESIDSKNSNTPQKINLATPSLFQVNGHEKKLNQIIKPFDQQQEKNIFQQKTQETFQTTDDDVNTQLVNQQTATSSQKRAYFIDGKYITNETNLVLIQEEMTQSIHSNLNMVNQESQKQFQNNSPDINNISPQLLYGQPKFIDSIVKQKEQFNPRKKIQIYRINKKEDDIESTDQQPTQLISLNRKLESSSPKNFNNSPENQIVTERELLNYKEVNKRNKSFDSTIQNGDQFKPSIFSQFTSTSLKSKQKYSKLRIHLKELDMLPNQEDNKTTNQKVEQVQINIQ
ncbi:kinase domain protein (macronuclear) [Tetrahymena thermophila SB210]|uniref:Kinase domain protein n=1 Tax=Tetrahymena thermophila (strain SB210) TaxID=312017 RepID=W7XHQ2_TETTS|nr:kinase domain protein [Tetrahymena thermophila SB210]EWS72684.1 kinase domain protein [Tetrahymena thermophila SB210]|eukprot:XP_012654784.1 kinase domain protein [Tetrahymena thermophila SB210]